MLINRIHEPEIKQQITITKDMVKHYLSRYATAPKSKNTDNRKEIVGKLETALLSMLIKRIQQLK